MNMTGHSRAGSRPLTRLLVATDFTPGAGAALARAARLPLGPRSRVTLLHVLTPVSPALRGREQAAARQRLAMEAAGLLKALRANELRADLIAAGSHRRRPVVGRLIGIVAEGVVRRASGDALVVPSACLMQ
jgi:nucleotide-binding universal stress UspA family protein